MGNFLDKIKKTFTFNDKFGNPMSWPEVEEVEAPAKSVTPSQFSHGASPYKSQETKPFTGIPAPNMPSYDPWFGPVVLSEKTIENMVQDIREHQEERKDAFSVEPDNMHQVMYDVSTRNENTTLDLNPLSPGGSENFHEGVGGWSSGTGQNQFR
jgi:hypothetical protein